VNARKSVHLLFSYALCDSFHSRSLGYENKRREQSKVYFSEIEIEICNNECSLGM